MIAQDIALWLTEKVGEISTANGFHTNVGVRVFRGRRRLDDDTPPCIVIAELEDTVVEQTRTQAHVQQVYAIEAHDVCDPDHPNDKCLLIIQDLKKAIFQDPTMGRAVKKIAYRGRTIGPRDEGNSLCFAAIRISVDYTENLVEG